MNINNNLLKELKNEIEILNHLGKKIKLGGNSQIETEYIWGNSEESKRYIIEIDRYEKPYLYYHFQYLKNHCEIRYIKIKKMFEVHCIGFTPNEEDIKKEYECIIIHKNYGGNTHNIYKQENFEIATDIYKSCIIDLMEYLTAKKLNLLIW